MSGACESKNGTGSIVPLLSFFVSLLALGLTISNSKDTIDNYKKSVLPHLGVKFTFNHEKGKYNTEPAWKVTLENEGIGPAIITKYSIGIKDQPQVSRVEHAKDLSAQLNLVGKGLFVDYEFPHEYQWIKPGTAIVLMSVHCNKDPDACNVLNLENLTKLTVHVDYSSVYDQEFELDRTATRK